MQDRMSLGTNVTATAGLRWEGQWNPQPTKPNPAIPYTAYIPNVQLQANYALARNMDDDSNEHLFRREPALNPFDLAAEWSYAKNDVRHNLNFSALTDMPWGFTAGAILFARTGAPYTPIIGFDTQNDANDANNENDRAIINGHVAGRNTIRQPAFFDLDVRLMKAFAWEPRDESS
jgi:hypothetical protein